MVTSLSTNLVNSSSRNFCLSGVHNLVPNFDPNLRSGLGSRSRELMTQDDRHFDLTLSVRNEVSRGQSLESPTYPLPNYVPPVAARILPFRPRPAPSIFHTHSVYCPAIRVTHSVSMSIIFRCVDSFYPFLALVQWLTLEYFLIIRNFSMSWND